jgi:hypothetical protein
MAEKYVNKSQQVIMEALEKANVKIKNPIMLTADQYMDYYCVSCNYLGVGINIPKNMIDEDEIRAIPDDGKYRFVLNKVWTQKY